MNETTFNKKTRLTSSVSLVFISYIHTISYTPTERFDRKMMMMMCSSIIHIFILYGDKSKAFHPNIQTIITKS